MTKPNHYNALLEAGLTMFHRKGYNATSVQDIVDLAGSPKGSFYNHFSSKEMLAKEVIDYYWSKAEKAREILGDTSLTVPERIDRHFKALGCPEEGCLIGNFTAELASEDRFRLHLAGVWNQWIKTIASCLSEGQLAGSVNKKMSPSDLAQLVINQWEGALLAFRIERNPDVLTKARRLIQEVIKS